MHAYLHAREAAPLLPRRRMRLRRCIGLNAFGNAIGNSLADNMSMSNISAGAASSGMVSLIDGSTISEAENVRRANLARGSFAANSIQDPSQASVLSDASDGMDDAMITSMRNQNLARIQSDAANSLASFIPYHVEINGTSSTTPKDDTEWYPHDGGGTLIVNRMTPEEEAAFDAMNSQDQVKELPNIFGVLKGIANSNLSLSDKLSWSLGNIQNSLRSTFLDPIPALVDIKDAGLQTIRPALAKAYATSVNPNSSFLSRWANTITAGQLAYNAGLTEAYTPTNGLELAMTTVGGTSSVRGVYREWKTVNVGMPLTIAASPASGNGLGRLTGRTVTVSNKGLAILEEHIGKFPEWGPNQAMVQRVRSANAEGRSISGADAIFYTHEIAEATKMRHLVHEGVSFDDAYRIAHPATIQKYGVSEFSVYHPEVIQKFPDEFNGRFREFWGVK